MKTNIILIVLFFCLTPLYSQTTVQKLNSVYAKYGADPEVNKIFVNSGEKILDIDGAIIPLEITTKAVTEANKTVNGIKVRAYVEFKCEDNCIRFEGEMLSGIGYTFKSKEGAYEFLDLIYALEKELK